MKKKWILIITFLISLSVVGTSVLAGETSAGGSVSNESVVGFYVEDPKPSPAPEPTPKPGTKLPQTGESIKSGITLLGIVILVGVSVSLLKKRARRT